MDFIESYPNAIPDELCDRLMSLMKSHPGIYQGRTGGGVDTAKKNSLDLMLDSHKDLDAIRNELINHTFIKVLDYFNQYSLALMGAVSVGVVGPDGQQTTLTLDNYQNYAESNLANIVRYLFRVGAINVQKYSKGVGGYPHWHSEQFPQIGGHEALHRVVLFMYYLNTVEQGGETEFFYQAKKIKPQKGTLVIAPAGFTHSHRGNIPQSDDKYIATSWILFNPAEQLYRGNNKYDK